MVSANMPCMGLDAHGYLPPLCPFPMPPSAAIAGCYASTGCPCCAAPPWVRGPAVLQLSPLPVPLSPRHGGCLVSCPLFALLLLRRPMSLPCLLSCVAPRLAYSRSPIPLLHQRRKLVAYPSSSSIPPCLLCATTSSFYLLLSPPWHRSCPLRRRPSSVSSSSSSPRTTPPRASGTYTSWASPEVQLSKGKVDSET